MFKNRNSFPVALVTGGAIRVGRAICKRLASTHRVAIHYNSSKTEAEELEAALKGAFSIASDLTVPSSPAKLVEGVVERLGRLDLLVNNAAVFNADSSDMLALAKMKILNLDAPRKLMKVAAPYLHERKGAVINIADVAGIIPFTSYKAYSNAKTALIEHGTRSALEYARKNIRINTICPGIVLPPGDSDPRRDQRLKDNIPLGRFGEPEDVADLVAFLAEATFITGQTIAVDGGRMLTHFDRGLH